MDDPTGQELGYTPEEYAFMLLRMSYQNLSDSEALQLIHDAVRDDCPQHSGDLKN